MELPPLLDGQGQRGDGRAAHECRPVFVKTGVIAAAGSAYVEFRSTKVLCGVYGPREAGPRAPGGGGGGGGAPADLDSGQLAWEVKMAAFGGSFKQRAAAGGGAGPQVRRGACAARVR